jgi:hypothetical protein
MRKLAIHLRLPLAVPVVLAVAVSGSLTADTAVAVDTGLWFDHRYSGNPVLSPNGGNAGIDDLGTAWGYLMTNGPNDYRMYYTGIDSSSDYDICLATSTDRINWTRSAKGMGGTQKVIDDGSAWAGPVWKEGSTYHMIYKKSGMTWYHVTSSNGISWGTATQCTGTLGTEASALMKIGNTYHVWGSTGSSSSPAQTYHFTSTNLTTWTVQNGGNPVLAVPGRKVICPDVFYNVDESKYYAVAAVTPFNADSPEKYYGSFRMWKADDPNFQTNKVQVGDLLICNAETLPLMADWEKGGSYDGQHFLWSDVYQQVHNSDPLCFYYSAEATLGPGYDFSMGLVSYPTVAAALDPAPEPSVLALIVTGTSACAALALQRRSRSMYGLRCSEGRA